MRPADLSMSSQRCASAVRTISLTPTGVSTNFILDHIIDDVVRGSTEGFMMTDCFGDGVTVFLHLTGFVADYPASSGVLDVMNHNSRCPCTHCTFRYKTDHTNDSEDNNQRCYSHNTDINFSDSTHRRGLYRTLTLRSSNINKTETVYLEMQDGSIQDISVPGRWPLLKTSVELDRRKGNRRLDSSGNIVVPGKFDPYCSNIIAPDHCLTGLIDGIIHLCFRAIRDELSDPSATLRFEFYLCRAVRDLGVLGHVSIYSEASGVNSLSMSTIYALATVLPSVLQCLNLHSVSSFHLSSKMTRLINYTFWWPTPDDDGYDFVHGTGKASYHRHLRDMSVDYINCVYEYGLSHASYKRLIDRPNTHRLLELYVHTIPLYGHALLVSEMTIEAAHQPLKSAMSRDNNPHAHISAVQHVLCTDWFRRLADMWKHSRQTSGNDLIVVKQSLRTLLCGLDVTQYISNEDILRSVQNDIGATLDELMTGAVGQVLLKFYSSPLYREDCHGRSERRKWVASTAGSDKSGFLPSRSKVRLHWEQKSISAFNTNLTHLDNNLPEKVFSKMICRSVDSARHYRHNIVFPGEVIEATIRQGTAQSAIIDSYEAASDCNVYVSRAFLFVRAHVGSNCNNVSANVCELQEINSETHLYKLPKESPDTTHLMEIHDNVRKCVESHRRRLVRTISKVDIVACEVDLIACVRPLRSYSDMGGFYVSPNQNAVCGNLFSTVFDILVHPTEVVFWVLWDIFLPL